jgi:hypothetical protein
MFPGPLAVVYDRPILSSERMLHKDYDRKGSVAKKKISGRGHQGPWRQDELIGGKPPVVEVTLTQTLTPTLTLRVN